MPVPTTSSSLVRRRVHRHAAAAGRRPSSNTMPVVAFTATQPQRLHRLRAQHVEHVARRRVLRHAVAAPSSPPRLGDPEAATVLMQAPRASSTPSLVAVSTAQPQHPYGLHVRGGSDAIAVPDAGAARVSTVATWTPRTRRAALLGTSHPRLRAVSRRGTMSRLVGDPVLGPRIRR